MRSIIVIPARMQSSRLPGKPLIDIAGKTLIQRTYERCIMAVPKNQIYVATDSVEIFKHCKQKNMQVVMTSENCLTGTDRVAEVAEQIEADYYINVQGDEPLMNPQDILDIIKAAEKYTGEIINGYAPINEEDYQNLTVPKVVIRPDGRLLYMSRSPIPGNKNGSFQKAWRQVCVYAFPKIALQNFTSECEKTSLEAQEDIEILRFLELGYEVRMIPLSIDSIAVDVPEDVEKVKQKLRKQ
jgi:3-deoxy-manno-octulosonate cytidylyltransferase (CMP-KDO synthetase)